MSSLPTSLRRRIEAAAGELDGVLQISLFGSTLTVSDPKDLDLLVTYDPGVTPPEKAVELRGVLELACGDLIEGEVDCVLLTEAEERESKFAEREGAVALYQRLDRNRAEKEVS
jgi:predicted nucleotidyltransferase